MLFCHVVCICTCYVYFNKDQSINQSINQSTSCAGGLHNVPPPQQVLTKRATQIIYSSGDLDLWPFDLGTGVNVIRGTYNQFWCICDFSLSSYGQTHIKLTTWAYTLDSGPLRSRHGACRWRVVDELTDTDSVQALRTRAVMWANQWYSSLF